MFRLSLNLEVSASSGPRRTAWLLKTGPTCCPEMSLKLPFCAVWNPKRTQISFTQRRKPEVTHRITLWMYYTGCGHLNDKSKPRATRNIILQKHQPILQTPCLHFNLQLESRLDILLLMHIFLRFFVVLKHEDGLNFHQKYPTVRRKDLTSILGRKVLRRGCNIRPAGCMWMAKLSLLLRPWPCSDTSINEIAFYTLYAGSFYRRG